MSKGSESETISSRLDPAQWVGEHGDCLFRFAMQRVRKTELAEDLVQDTLLAAVRAIDGFSGKSSERSWLVGILKHKIVDHFRKSGRETSFTDMDFLNDEMSHKFENGFWNHDLGPQDWRQREEVRHSSEFWQTMGGCLAKLPPRVAQVFMLREMDGIRSSDICADLEISESNLWVMLHRARMALRECLEIHWFGSEKASFL
jgi:RNA polymerase sigma-70 factor (ECF subfamily)